MHFDEGVDTEFDINKILKYTKIQGLTISWKILLSGGQLGHWILSPSF